MTITTVGLDIAKQVIQVHAVDVRGKPIVRQQLKRHPASAVLRESVTVPHRH